LPRIPKSKPRISRIAADYFKPRIQQKHSPRSSSRGLPRIAADTKSKPRISRIAADYFKPRIQQKPHSPFFKPRMPRIAADTDTKAADFADCRGYENQSRGFRGSPRIPDINENQNPRSSA
jgi:hypothetical protein